jgi:hypothetical protein
MRKAIILAAVLAAGAAGAFDASPLLQFVTAGGATPWYLAGGVSASSCVAAYQPKGAASLAASYNNLANSSYALTVGATVPWDSTNGWKFNETGYLKTGIIPTNNWSMIVAFTNVSRLAANSQTLIGASKGTTGRFQLLPWQTGNSVAVWGYDVGTYTHSSYVLSGVMCLSGTNSFLNGSYVGPITSPITLDTLELYVGSRNLNGASTLPLLGDISAVAIYNAPLTAAQVSAISAAIPK